LNPIESEFLAASKAEEQRIQHEKEQQQQRELEAVRQLAAVEQQRAHEQLRSNRRLRFFAMGITLIFVVTLAAAWIAIEQRDRANRTIHLAHSRELAAAALNNLVLDPQLSILLALEAVKESQVAREPVSAEIESTLHQAVRHSKQKLVLRGHTSGVYGSSFSPDGRWVATASRDATVKIWDPQTGELIRTLEGHQAEVTSAVFHPSGSWLASTGRDHTTYLWNLETGEDIWSFTDQNSFASVLDFNIDGSQVGIVLWDGRIIILDISNGQEIHKIQANPYIIWIEYSPDGSLIAVVDVNGVVQFFDAKTGIEREEKKLEFNSETQSFLAFSPDGKKLAISSMDGWIKLWDLENSQIVWSIEGQPGSRYAPVRFSPNGRYLVTASFAKGAQVWEVSNGKLVMTFSGHTNAIHSVGFSPDGRQIITGSEDGTARIWDFSPAREVAVISSPQGLEVPPGSRRAAFSPDGRWVAAGEGDEGAIGVWDAKSGERFATLQSEQTTGAVTAVDFHPDGGTLAAADMDGNITMWDPVNERMVMGWIAYEGYVAALSFNHTGDQVFSLGEDGIIKRWDSKTGERLGHPGIVYFSHYSLAISPDDRFVLMPTYWGALSLVDLYNGEEVANYRGQIGEVWEIAFSHDGKMIASAYSDGIVFLFDTASKEKLHILEHPLTAVIGLAFSSDGRQLATVSLDDTLRLWDTATGRLNMVLEGVSDRRPNGVVFSPDDRKVAVSSEDGISLYLTHLEDLVQLAEERLARGFTAQECQAYAITGCLVEEAPNQEVQIEPSENGRLLACHLQDLGGISVSIFNRIPHEGMLQAAQKLGWDTQTIEPILISEMRDGMGKFLQSGCDLIILTTFDEVTVAVPEDHPDQNYIFVTLTDELREWENVWSAVYGEDQPSFLAGYLAAAMTRTGKLGIFGGAPIPAVFRFMDGFALGVEHYNRQSTASVDLIGWTAGGDPSQGIFAGFNNTETAFKTTTGLIDAGADIIFPVAGQRNMVAASEAALIHEGIYVIGVDEDWAANNPQYALSLPFNTAWKPSSGLHLGQTWRYILGRVNGSHYQRSYFNDKLALFRRVKGSDAQEYWACWSRTAGWAWRLLGDMISRRRDSNTG
jgi:WD40 repeat protein/basic membrane lipoprotein Med (substrate-binding protein (PBP1-ABC) superfamily)